MSGYPYVAILNVYYHRPIEDRWNDPGYTCAYLAFQDEEDWKKHESYGYEQAKDACRQWLKFKFPNENKTLDGPPKRAHVLGYVTDQVYSYGSSDMPRVPPFQ